MTKVTSPNCLHFCLRPSLLYFGKMCKCMHTKRNVCFSYFRYELASSGALRLLRDSDSFLQLVYFERIHSNPRGCHQSWGRNPIRKKGPPGLEKVGWGHTFYFRGFVDLVILLSLLSSYVVFVLKVAWLAHVTLRKNNKTQGAVAPLYFGSRHAHNTRKESTDSSRRNVAGAILYCHRYKRSYGWVHRWGSFYFSWHGDENDRCSRYPGKQLWNR